MRFNPFTPGERESTQHGVSTDITVPALRLRGIIVGDEVMIAATMLAMLILWTVIDTWILPLFLVIIAIIMLRLVFRSAPMYTADEFRNRIIFAIMVCFGCFVAGYFLKDWVYNRIQLAIEALWQWPPLIGQFLYLITFIFVPFLIPLIVRPPLLTDFFRITLKDPTWPSPRMAKDIEGVQSPDMYDDDDPRGEPEMEHIKSTVSDGNGHEKSIFLEKTPRMRAFAKAVLTGKPFKEATARSHLGYGRKRWEKFRDEFFRREWAVWNNEEHHQDGILLLGEGRQALRNILPPHSGKNSN